MPDKRPFILGTDWWTDVDDAVAVRVFARAHKAGAIDIKGVVINACMEYSCASLDAFLCNEGLTDMPIGIDLSAVHYGGKPPYQERMAVSGRFRSNGDCDDAARLYRKILAETEAVEMAEIGYCTALYKLITSPPDDVSPMSGYELLEKKVRRMWVMAGKWDEPDGGYENNLCRTKENMRAASGFYAKCPVPVTFLGYEIGVSVLTGDVLKGADDMLARALYDHGSENGRPSWDPMLALLAVAGDAGKAGYREARGTAAIDPEDGKNKWIGDENGRHGYVVKLKPDDYYKNEINGIIAG